MEPPLAFEATSVRDEKVKVLKQVRPITPEEIPTHTVRGQYEDGWVLGGKGPVYREGENVAGHTGPETYAALKLYVDNWRWSDTPFYIRVGKRLPKAVTEI